MIAIIPAEPAHAEALAALTDEMDRFYGATEIEPRDLRIRQIHEALFATPPPASALLAWDGDQLIGFASYSFLWPAVGLTRSLYLKELYVAQTDRRRGIGSLLMQHLCEIAAKHDCSRLEWTTDRGNSEAQQFYGSMNAPVAESKLFYRLERGALLRAAVSAVEQDADHTVEKQ